MGFLILKASEVQLLMFILIHYYFVHGTINELSWSNADKVLRAVCPNTDICGLPPSNAKDVNACCTKCSCDEDCATRNTCCFKNYHSTNDYETCLFPRSKYNREYIQSKSESLTDSYYMVAKQPATGCVNGQRDGCNTIDPALMAPVTSSNSLTYFNADCALCHGVKDFQEWESVLICDRLGNSLPIDFEEEVTKFFLDQESSVCFLYYFLLNGQDLFPCQIPKPKREENSKDYIDDTKVDFSINISDIYHACISGMDNSVLSLTNMIRYSNPFCLVYAEGFPEPLGDVTCNMMTTEALTVDYTSLLNPRVKEIVQSHDQKDHLQVACLGADSSAIDIKNTGCRPVRCPFGHVLDQNSDCIFFGNSIWGVGRKTFAAHLVLQSTTKDNIDGFINISVDEIKDALQIPSEWTLSFIGIAAFNLTPGGSQDNEILVELRQSKPDISSVLTALRLQLEKSIALRNDKINYTFTQNIYPLSLILTDSLATIHCTQETANDIHNGTGVPSYSTCWKPLLSTFSVESDSIKISEMYFCNLIELMPGEFHLFSNGSVLYNRLRGRYLYKKQFILMEDDLGSTRAMVCVDNSGFVQVVDRGTLNNAEWVLLYICVIYQFLGGDLDI